MAGTLHSLSVAGTLHSLWLEHSIPFGWNTPFPLAGALHSLWLEHYIPFGWNTTFRFSGWNTPFPLAGALRSLWLEHSTPFGWNIPFPFGWKAPFTLVGTLHSFWLEHSKSKTGCPPPHPPPPAHTHTRRRGGGRWGVGAGGYVIHFKSQSRPSAILLTVESDFLCRLAWRGTCRGKFSGRACRVWTVELGHASITSAACFWGPLSSPPLMPLS